MRLFIALEFPENVRKEAHALLDGIALPDFKAVEEENIHLTLKFLGEAPETILQGLEASLADVARAYDPFSFRVSGGGAFPTLKRPRVLWLAVKTPDDYLARLAQDIDAACAAYGVPRENRPFSPHVTLGRFRMPPRALDVSESLSTFIERARSFDATIDAQEFVLFRSTLTPRGPIYRALARFPLAGSG
jgi:2'-5' RNA ligase